jgi:hypothetical protein
LELSLPSAANLPLLSTVNLLAYVEKKKMKMVMTM